jgi:hypothetical protein
MAEKTFPFNFGESFDLRSGVIAMPQLCGQREIEEQANELYLSVRGILVFRTKLGVQLVFQSVPKAREETKYIQ